MICSFVWNEIHVNIITDFVFFRVFFFILNRRDLYANAIFTCSRLIWSTWEVVIVAIPCRHCCFFCVFLLSRFSWFVRCTSCDRSKKNMSSASTVASAQQNEVEDSIRRIQTHKGVQGFIITSNDGKIRA